MKTVVYAMVVSFVVVSCVRCTTESVSNDERGRFEPTDVPVRVLGCEHIKQAVKEWNAANPNNPQLAMC